MSASIRTGEEQTTSDKTPYEKAVSSVEQVSLEARSLHGIGPAPIVRLIIEEAFALLQQGALYSGMGEEAVTAAFASALAAAAEAWRRHWIWSGGTGQDRILWNHYSRSSETVLGADFSIVLADLSPDNSQLDFRLIVAQAKRHTANDPKRVHVERKAFSTADGKEVQKMWEKVADERLGKALGDGQAPREYLSESDMGPGAPNWQLTRLLGLQQVLKDTGADFVYVVWPATPKKSGDSFNPVYYEKLDIVCEQVRENPKSPTERYLQSFSLDTTLHFRDYLLNYKQLAAISEGQLKDVLKTIQAQSAATIVINASGEKLSKELTELLKATEVPRYEPSGDDPYPPSTQPKTGSTLRL